MNNNTQTLSVQSLLNVLGMLVSLFVLIPLFIALAPVILIGILLTNVLLHILVWLKWNSHGIRLLYVYSNSPHWKEYIEQNILPRLPSNAIVLNWSERKTWKFSLTTLVFRFFGGSREFNPMAFVFRPFRKVRIFRFFKPFQEFKHGRPEALAQLESDFFSTLNQ